MVLGEAGRAQPLGGPGEAGRVVCLHHLSYIESLLLSGMTMSEFVAEFVGVEKPLCALGMKLPLNFDVTRHLADKLRRVKGVHLVQQRKIFQQRFVLFVAKN